MVHPHDGIVAGNIMKSMIRALTRMSLKYIMLSEAVKDYIIHDSIYFNVQRRQICGNRKQMSGCRGTVQE